MTSKCLFCDSFSIINEGLCSSCKYYRYTKVRRENKDLKSKIENLKIDNSKNNDSKYRNDNLKNNDLKSKIDNLKIDDLKIDNMKTDIFKLLSTSS